MQKTTQLYNINIICLIVSVFLVSSSYASDLLIGDSVVLSGTLQLNTGSKICFPDTTCFTTATGSGGTSISSWGSITGNIYNQSDLMLILSNKQDVSLKGSPYGYPGLDAFGKIPLNQLPDIVTQDISAVWGQITGLIENQTDLNTALSLKEDKTNRDIPDGYAGLDSNKKILPESMYGVNRLNIKRMTTDDSDLTWKTQGNNWIDFTGFSLTFNKVNDSSLLVVSWSDNVGVYSSVWCNVGLFLDDNSNPVCNGSWSGNQYTNIFAQHDIKCTLENIASGEHVLHVKHRSQYCMYGNFAFDEYGLNRYIEALEINQW